MSDEHPELSGYEPHAPRPLRGPRATLLLRAIVLLAVLALILPGLVTTVSVGARNAALACEHRGSIVLPGAPASEARFEVLGPGGLGWECYATDQLGDERHIDSMGLIPVAPRQGSPVDTRDT